MTEFDPIASLRFHAEMFDVYPGGMAEVPAFTTDAVTSGQMDRAGPRVHLPRSGGTCSIPAGTR